MATDPTDPSPFIIMAFVEFLAFNNLAFASISNDTSALCSDAKWLNIPMPNLDHPRVHLMFKAVKNSPSKSPIFKTVFDITTHSIVLASPYVLCYISIYLMALSGFFRISNLGPLSKLSFNPKLHLCQGDVIFNQDIVMVLMQWSKTLQNPNQGSYITIPKLGSSPLCPVSAVQKCHKYFLFMKINHYS